MSPKRQPGLNPQTFFNRLEAAAYYDQHHDLLPKERLAFAAIPPHASILDVGCGTGRTTACLRRQGHQVIGVDISYAMIQSAHQACGDTAVLVNDACYLSFKPHEFDVVVFSFNGMDYIYPYADRLQALQEIKRVLKPGGLFIFSSHNHCLPRDRQGVMPFLTTLLKRKRSTYIDSTYAWGTCKIYLTTPELQIAELEQLDFELVTIIPRRILRKIRSLNLLGFLDSYLYYVFLLP